MAEATEGAAPLLAREDGGGRGGGATWAPTLRNVVVSIVGTRVLGLPYAFRTAGWLAGSLDVTAAGCATLYCMFLLVDCRDKLEEESSLPDVSAPPPPSSSLLSSNPGDLLELVDLSGNF